MRQPRKESRMSSRCRRSLIAGATALGIALMAALPGALSASASTNAPIQRIKLGHALYDAGVHSDVTRAEAAGAALAATTFPQYKSTVTVGTAKYTYVIAGKNPSVKVTNPVSTVNVLLVPLVMRFTNGDTWNPNKIDSCDSGASALTRTQNSPIVQSQPWTWGGTAIGTGQVTNAFQRAEFWKYAKPTGTNPTFAVNLAVTTHSAVPVIVPPADEATGTARGCGNGLVGATDINWLDPYIQKTVIPSLGVSPATVPIFLVHNFVEYVATASQCCVIGYHNAYTRTTGVQTYGLGDYDNSRAFPGAPDIAALTHEIAEWQNDPYGNNPTPAWGNVGQVSGCQSNLEVGDPLSGTTFADTVGGFTYHPQELAFFAWFYDQKPGAGVNGWYSDQGAFKSPAAACPPGGV